MSEIYQSERPKVDIDYDHNRNTHSLEGAAAALSTILGSNRPESLLDVGCGAGTWLRAAMELGIANVLGVDGIVLDQGRLQVASTLIERLDLSKPFDLGRRFDVVLCLEVAEHLPAASSDDFISSIVSHSDSILFSAACPGQPGQHHVNCQWPAYWQSVFNNNGFACDDNIRWQIWDNSRIEPWYRQNIFWAHREPENAGREPRLKAVIHPGMYKDMMKLSFFEGRVEGRLEIEKGSMPVSWYVMTPALAAAAKLGRLIVRPK